MPLVSFKTSLSHIPEIDTFHSEISTLISSLTNKPEAYIMIVIEPDVSMSFASSLDPSCYIEVKSIGSLNPQLITQKLSELIESRTNIPSSRMYFSFSDVKASDWGFNRKTFG